MRRNLHSGFTLVEMSIVLVIIGLIVGGIIAGQSLLRISGIRSTMTDLSDYASAVGKFRTEFRNLPGDLSTATSYWGAVAGTGSDAACFAASQANGVATCNGNGNGVLDPTNSFTGVADATEMYLAWKHLSNAGVIATQNLTGRTANTGGYGIVGGTNAPAGKIDGSTFLLTSYVCYTADATFYDGCYPLVILFGKSASTSFTPGVHFSPEEMSGIDKKMDDGNPGYGQVRALKSDSTCNSSATAYALTSTGLNCRGIFAVDPITANQ